jgi:hypothetical protein
MGKDAGRFRLVLRIAVSGQFNASTEQYQSQVDVGRRLTICYCRNGRRLADGVSRKDLADCLSMEAQTTDVNCMRSKCHFVWNAGPVELGNCTSFHPNPTAFTSLLFINFTAESR